jgi:hypothetical protein
MKNGYQIAAKRNPPIYILKNQLYKESNSPIYSYIPIIKYIEYPSIFNSKEQYLTPYDYYYYLFNLGTDTKKTLEDIRYRRFKGIAVDLDALYRYYKTNVKVKEKYFKPIVYGKL